MKLTEAIQFKQPLFESFKDLETVLEKSLSEVEDREIDEVTESFEAMQEALGDDFNEFGEVDFRDPSFFVKVAKKALRNRFAIDDLSDILQAPKNLPNLSRGEAYILQLKFTMTSITSKANRPENQNPEYELVTMSSNYEVYHIQNYAAARAFCNRYNADHCIGSSNTQWFKGYEREYDGQTHAITTGAKLIYVHSGTRGFLITSSDNTSEIDNKLKERGGGLDRIVEELRGAGLSNEDIINAFREAMPYYDSFKDDFSVIIEIVEEVGSDTLVYLSSDIEIFTKTIENKPFLSFKRKGDGIEFDVMTRTSNSFFTILDGTTEPMSNNDVAETLFRFFGIDGTNVDKIANNASLSMNRDHKQIMSQIADSFI